MINKLIEQQETIKGMQENEDSAIKLLKENVELKKKYLIMKNNAETLAKRIDKAIEYIEQLPFNDLTPIEVKVIYKILQGGDKE